jgi:hypothetical protein
VSQSSEFCRHNLLCASQRVFIVVVVVVVVVVVYFVIDLVQKLLDIPSSEEPRCIDPRILNLIGFQFRDSGFFTPEERVFGTHLLIGPQQRSGRRKKSLYCRESNPSPRRGFLGCDTMKTGSRQFRNVVLLPHRYTMSQHRIL